MEVTTRFVLMEHLARRSGKHYDLRFKRPFGLMWDSFATKKDVPPEPGKRIILWKTTLHSREDALLTGTIKTGYGAGILKKVDYGECIIKKYTDHHMIIEFKGNKLKGTYHLFHPQMTGPTGKKYADKAFMFFKGRDTEVKEQTNLSENALIIARARYFMNNEDWGSFSTRVASAPAEIEKDKEVYKEKFSEMVYKMDFLGGGRILRNSGREKGSMLNCFHLPCGDSIQEIADFIKDSLILWSEGGGVGASFSQLRPKGDVIKGKGGYSSGPISFIEAANAVSLTIESGGARRAAALGSLSISHPDIFDFIDAKIVQGKISHFNISVEITNHFIESVQKDLDWTLEFNGKNYKTVKAREIWDKIVSNMITHAEPGILNMDNVTENNSWYFAPVTGVNPCHTGDTLVYVADGRGLVSFEQLVKEEKDIPVFSLNKETKKIEVQIMRNPRKTGYEKIFKVYLDDGTFFRSNGAHKVTTIDGSEKKVIDLLAGDRLHHLTKYQTKMSTMITGSTNESNYIMLNTGYQCNVAEHRVIAEFKIGRPLEKNETVHHEDYRYQNNSPKNLVAMLKKDHDDLHRKDKLGALNPIHRFPEKNYFKNHKFVGLENGNCSGKTIEDLFELALKLTIENGRRVSSEEWKNYCKENDYPHDGAFVYKEYGCISNFLEEVSRKANVLFIDRYHISRYNQYLKVKEETDLDIFFDNNIKVRKKCETCGKEFIVLWGSREKCFCNICNDQYLISYKRKSEDYVEEATFNYKVTRIEEDGYEDVFNGTVDKNHNYYVYVGDSVNKAGKINMNFINSMNCGEAVLEPYGSCDLGSLVLPNFIDDNGNTNWQNLKETIFLGVRFLDNVLDVNKFTIDKISENARNSRRVGVGVMGLAEYLFKKKVRYGSEESLVQIQELMSFIRDNCYLASVQIAKEKGPFPKFDRDLYLASSFVKTLPKEVQTEIYNNGIRNVTLIAIAPTGTISLLPEVSSSIEPLFAKSFIRRDRAGNRVYIHPLYEKLITETHKIPKWFVDAYDLSPNEHIAVQRVVQRFVDGAVSKTINLPRGTTKEQLSELLLNNIKYLKGVTVYVDGSRPGQILNKMSDAQVVAYLKRNGKLASHVLTEDDVDCNVCSKAKEYKARDYEDIKKEVMKNILSKKGGN